MTVSPGQYYVTIKEPEFVVVLLSQEAVNSFVEAAEKDIENLIKINDSTI